MLRSYLLSTLVILALNNSIADAQVTPWQNRGIGGGGALFSPSINPYNSQELWVACDMSGLYKSSDWGLSWSIQNAQKIQAGTNTCIQYTSNPQEILAIDHTPQSGNDYSQPVRSTDGGNSWSPIANDPTNGEAYTLITDPNRTDRILISNYDHLWYSDDGGQTFVMLLTFNNGGNGLHVAGAFFDGNNIYIGTSAGMLVSTNGGSIFIPTTLPGWPNLCGMSSFCGAKTGNTTRLYAVAMLQTDLYGGITGADFGSSVGVYTCDGAGTTWTAHNFGINPDHKLFFVACARNNIDKVFLAGGDVVAGNPVVYHSIDGGNIWTSVFNTTLNNNIITGWCGVGGDRGWGYAEYILGLAVSPLDADIASISDLGFVHTTINGGSNWKQAYVSFTDQNAAGANTPAFKSYHSSGLENTTCWSIAWNNSNSVFAGFSDINGIKSDDAGVSWKMAGATTQNSTYHFVKHPSNGNLYVSTSTVHDIYQTTRLTDALLDPGLGQIRYSSNGGSSWQLLHDFNHPVIWLATDPGNANRMYASVIHYANGIGEGDVWKCDNIQAGSSSTWTRLNSPPRTQGHPLSINVLNDGSVVASYCARRNGSGTFTASSGVFLLNAGSSNWIDRSDAGMQYYTKDLVVDPSDAQQNTWYACVWSGWGGAPNGLGGLYKTTNRGLSWTKIFSGADRVSSITFDPQHTGEAWMSTETEGLWKCTGLNTVSPTFIRDNNFPFRQPERIFFNPYQSGEIWVTTFGSGLYKSGITSTGINEIAATKISVYPNPSSGTCFVSAADEIISYSLKDLTGRTILEKKNIFSENLELENMKKGVYLLTTLFRENKMEVHKIIIN
ncbi:hypothetical protein BH11BAC2_BH11BAC2_05770 [soil metagenome]